MKLVLLASVLTCALASPGSFDSGDGSIDGSKPNANDTLPGLLGCESVYYVTFDGPVCGVIAFGAKGSGGNVTVQTIRDGITGLDAGPGFTSQFPYHVHEYPVPSDGNCTGTGPHLDPFNVTEGPKCDPNLPDKCQVGDLAGKHGNLTGPTATIDYVDSNISLDENSVGFIGGRAVVIHRSDLTRFVCANITRLDVGLLNNANPEDMIPVPQCKTASVSSPGDLQPTAPPVVPVSAVPLSAPASGPTSYSSYSTTVVTATVQTTTSVTSPAPLAVFTNTSGAQRNVANGGCLALAAVGLLVML